MKKTTFFGAVSAFLMFALVSCGTSGSAVGEAAAGGASGALSAYYTGDGGAGKSIAVYAPACTGLTADQDYVPDLVQGSFVQDLSTYSAMSVRRNEDEVQGEDYVMTGEITKTSVGYTLSVRVETAGGSRDTVGQYNGECTIQDFETFKGTQLASMDLLTKMGVNLTAAAKAKLASAASGQDITSRTAQAQGRTADKSGNTAAAALYYTQAAAIDPSMLQAANRASVLTAQIASGNPGSGTRDLIQQRKDWITLLTDTEESINQLVSSATSQNPPYGLYYSTEIVWGDINYQTETRNASFQTNLRGRGYWFDSMEKAVQSVYGAVYDGLNATGHKDEWGLGNWPRSRLSQNNPFNKRWSWNMNVVFELVNADGKVIGRQPYSATRSISFSTDGNKVKISVGN